MSNKQNSPLIRLMSIAMIWIAATSCRSGKDSLEGNTRERVLGSSKANLDANVGSASSGSLEKSSLESNAAKLPGVYTSGSQGSEQVEPPSIIAGALLYCFKDKVEATKATILCALQDDRTGKPINLASTYLSHAFGFTSSLNVDVSITELPSTARWQVEYTIVASSVVPLKAALKNLNFAFEGEKAATGVTDTTFAKVVTDQSRPDFTIHSLKPQASATDLRCLDYFRQQGQNIVAAACGASDSAQDWFLTPDSKIAHVSGVCLRFEPGTGLGIEGDCTTAETPRFDLNISGSLIQIRDTGTCLSLVNPDNSGIDTIAAVPCNSGDTSQQWKIGSRVL